MFFVPCVSYAFASVRCCLVATCWERAVLLALGGGTYPHAFLKKRRGYCNRLHPSIRLSVMLFPPKPLDEIQPNLVCVCLFVCLI